jgi:hypothetical protein
VYVRLSAAWADPAGLLHDPGDLVDVDLVTLAKLEEQGVVDNVDGLEQSTRTGPATVDEKPVKPSWLGPGDDTTIPDDDDAPDADSDDDQ